MPYSDDETRRIARRASYQKRKEKILAQEKKYRLVNQPSKRQIKYKQRYGITAKQFSDMIWNQNNKCLICKETFKVTGKKLTIHVDHCHKSNKVRGLLCARCNVGLGLFNDDPDRLRVAIAYLES